MYVYIYIYICLYIYIYIYIYNRHDYVLKEYQNSSNKRCVFCLIFTMQHIHTLVSCSYIYIYI